MDATARPSVFISYSRKDGKWLDALTTMLAPVVRAGIASVWWDKKIKPSQIWRHEIDAAMASTRVAVLLVSPHFLASDFIQNEELPYLLATATRQRGVKLLWVLVSPCLYEYSPLQDIQAAHDISKSLSELKGSHRQAAIANISRAVVEALSAHPHAADPGFAPPLHNLPYPSLGDLFTGRYQELDALIGGGTAAITQSAAISGLGGIGKTRLAVEYAWRFGHRYTAVWFVRADSPENLRRNLASLAEPELLNLPEWEAQVEDKTVAAVKRSLREHPGWLMILDNVDTPEAAGAVLEILPSLYKGRALITSRLTPWPASVWKRSLDTLARDEAVHFLLHRTEDGRTKAADDATQATALAEALDGLPLALEQAAAFIVRNRMRLVDYLRAWEGERRRVLQWFDPQVMRYPASVAATWQHTFQQLTPTAAALLRLTAFLAPDPIPVEIFEQGAEHVKRAAELFCEEAGMAADRKTIREAMADLADYSLITRQDGGMLVVHRMVQEALRSQVPEEHRRDWIEGALRIVDDAAVEGSDDVRTWPVWDRLRPHVAEIVARADEVGIVEPTNRLLSDLGILLWAKGLYSEAEPLVRHALATAEASFGNQHPNVAVPLNNLAWLLKETNRLDEAEPLMRRALDIDQASFGKEHPRVAVQLSNLAQLLQDTNRLEEAEPLMQRALDIDQASFGNQHPNVARDLNNLAQLLQDTNRREEAEPLMRRALAIDEASLDPQHPNVASSLNNLGRLLQATKRLGEAEPLMRRAVEIYETSLGPGHPRTQNAQRNLAKLLAERAQTSEEG
jgi:tetratricopeptide (TPR) repeat protein